MRMEPSLSSRELSSPPATNASSDTQYSMAFNKEAEDKLLAPTDNPDISENCNPNVSNGSCCKRKLGKWTALERSCKSSFSNEPTTHPSSPQVCADFTLISPPRKHVCSTTRSASKNPAHTMNSLVSNRHCWKGQGADSYNCSLGGRDKVEGSLMVDEQNAISVKHRNSHSEEADSQRCSSDDNDTDFPTHGKVCNTLNPSFSSLAPQSSAVTFSEKLQTAQNDAVGSVAQFSGCPAHMAGLGNYASAVLTLDNACGFKLGQRELSLSDEQQAIGGNIGIIKSVTTGEDSLLQDEEDAKEQDGEEAASDSPEKTGNWRLQAVLEAFGDLSPTREGRVKTLIRAFESLMSKGDEQVQKPKKFPLQFSYLSSGMQSTGGADLQNAQRGNAEADTGDDEEEMYELGHELESVDETVEEEDAAKQWLEQEPERVMVDVVEEGAKRNSCDGQEPQKQTADVNEDEGIGNTLKKDEARNIHDQLENQGKHVQSSTKVLNNLKAAGDGKQGERNSSAQFVDCKSKPVKEQETRDLSGFSMHPLRQVTSRTTMKLGASYMHPETRHNLHQANADNDKDGQFRPTVTRKRDSGIHSKPSLSSRNSITRLSLARKSERQTAVDKSHVVKPQPFKLLTEARGHMKKQEFLMRLRKLLEEEEKLRVPLAQGLPWTTDEPEILSKPAVKENTKPLDIHLNTDLRAMERAEFDRFIAEKLLYLEERRSEQERLRRVAEDEEVKKMRQEMVPKAQLMPYFDRPFRPKRSSKHPTIPKEPQFHHNKQSKRQKCVANSARWENV